MTIEYLDKLAHKGEPSPPRLTHFELIYYREVRKLYADVANGSLSVDDAKQQKKEVVEAYKLIMKCMEEANESE